MANRTLFQSAKNAIFGRDGKRVTTVANEAGGRAFELSNEQKLAQYAATGCLSRTFYAGDADQLDSVLALCEDIAPEFIAKVAIYAREQGFMKDVPALLCAVLAARAPELLPKTFARVIDNARMLRTFVQILRSGAVGRRSLGTMPRRLVREWLDSRSDAALVAASVGQAPSLADIIRMVHPKPKTKARSALYAYLCSRDYSADDLPQPLRTFEAFKNGVRANVPDVPFQMLTALDLTTGHWRTIAKNASWQMTRMNLNTFSRHGVFEIRKMVTMVASQLQNREAIQRAKVFPYQLMAAYMNANEKMPREILAALQDAMEIATANVPKLLGKVYVCVDVSGSMHSSVSGNRKGATSKVRCVDVAALFAAAILRNNPSAEVIPFAEEVRHVLLNPRDSVMTNAEKLSSLPWGGTDCSAPLRQLVATKAEGDLVILISDNESWINPGSQWSTQTLAAWQEFKKHNPRARMVCLDIQPYATVQAPASQDILHVGGFSDQVFKVVSAFLASGNDADHWVKEIERVAL